MKKKQLNEKEQLNEFIGKLAAALFTKKADKIVKALQSNPKVHNAVRQYKKDTDEFKKRIDDLGIGSFEDLIAATKKDPNVRDLESARDQMDRLRRELN
mgnify:CR=1 FL=1